MVGGESFAVDASLIEADANRQRSIPGVEWKKQIDPTAVSRAVKEYLSTLNDATFGAATEVQPKFVSTSDPAAQWTPATTAAVTADIQNLPRLPCAFSPVAGSNPTTLRVALWGLTSAPLRVVRWLL